MNKDLTYYMSLTYPVTIVEIPESEGGGYSVSIPMLGRAAYVGDGASIEEALASLRKVQRFLFERVLKQGKPIPEPDDATGADWESCSGRFVLRVPRELHAHLRGQARRNSISLNQYCQYLLTCGGISEVIHQTSHEVGMMAWLHNAANAYDVQTMVGRFDYEKLPHHSTRSAASENEPQLAA